MTTAKQLTEEYKKNLQELQEACKHTKKTWCKEHEMHGNYTGTDLLQCKRCWKIVRKESRCEACNRKYMYEDRDYSTSMLCPDCSKKGKYYCWQHKKFYNDTHGCPLCIKIFENAEESEENK